MSLGLGSPYVLEGVEEPLFLVSEAPRLNQILNHRKLFNLRLH